MSDHNDENCHCTTKFNFREFNLTWTIEQFDFICRKMEIIESPRFPFTSSEKVKWYIQFHPTDLKIQNEELFKIELRNTASAEMYIKVNIFLENFSGIKLDFRSELNVLPSGNYLMWTKTGSEIFKKLEWNKTEIKTVKLKCSVSILNSINNNIQKPLLQKNDDLLNQIGNFHDDETFKDITFKVKTQKIKAHKMMLTLRSPVFAARFKNKVYEEQTSNDEIKDIKPAIFQKMLQFIYTDKVENLKEFSIELYYAAEKFQLEKLKRLCINSLRENLSIETIIKTFEFTEIFRIADLKQQCLKYLATNLEVLKETSEYKKLLKSYPNLSTEILQVQKAINTGVVVDHEEYSAKTIYKYK